MPSSPLSPFDPLSGELLPAYREEYVQGRLSPGLAQTVETYLKSSPIQTNIVLGRATVLASAAQADGRPCAPPAWVQEQLRYQPTASATGPLRRPVVRLALGLFLLLTVASVVQWLRNEPLVPAPVANAVAQAARSATQATRHLVQRFTAPSAPVPAPEAASDAAVRAPHQAVDRPAPPVPIEARVARVATTIIQPADLLATAPPAAGTVRTVRGRITDSHGRPLPGATVLVQGARQATSTNSAGDYELTLSVGSTLQFGYGGCADQWQRYAGASTLNVALLPDTSAATAALDQP